MCSLFREQLRDFSIPLNFIELAIKLQQYLNILKSCDNYRIVNIARNNFPKNHFPRVNPSKLHVRGQHYFFVINFFVHYYNNWKKAKLFKIKYRWYFKNVRYQTRRIKKISL